MKKTKKIFVRTPEGTGWVTGKTKDKSFNWVGVKMIDGSKAGQVLFFPEHDIKVVKDNPGKFQGHCAGGKFALPKTKKYPDYFMPDVFVDTIIEKLAKFIRKDYNRPDIETKILENRDEIAKPILIDLKRNWSGDDNRPSMKHFRRDIKNGNIWGLPAQFVLHWLPRQIERVVPAFRDIKYDMVNAGLFWGNMKPILNNPSALSVGTRDEAEHKGTYKMIKRTVARTGKIPPAKKVFRSIAKEHIKKHGKNYYKKLKAIEKNPSSDYKTNWKKSKNKEWYLAEAYNYGVSAFKLGQKRVPAHDKPLMGLIKRLNVPAGTGQGSKILKAWLSGWDTMNLKKNPDVSPEFMAKVERLARLIEKERNEAYPFPGQPSYYKMKILNKGKYIYIDEMVNSGKGGGQSGKLMIDTDGQIWGINGYGKINHGHFFGTLDTIENYRWGEYRPQKKSQARAVAVPASGPKMPIYGGRYKRPLLPMSQNPGEYYDIDNTNYKYSYKDKRGKDFIFFITCKRPKEYVVWIKNADYGPAPIKYQAFSTFNEASRAIDREVKFRGLKRNTSPALNPGKRKKHKNPFSGVYAKMEKRDYFGNKRIVKEVAENKEYLKEHGIYEREKRRYGKMVNNVYTWAKNKYYEIKKYIDEKNVEGALKNLVAPESQNEYSREVFKDVTGVSLKGLGADRVKAVVTSYLKSKNPTASGRASAFDVWIDTFIDEKGIDLEDTFEFDNENGFNLMSYGVVVEAMKHASPDEQKKIKEKIVYIDFKNGDVKHFLRYLGQALAKSRNPGKKGDTMSIVKKIEAVLKVAENKFPKQFYSDDTVGRFSGDWKDYSGKQLRDYYSYLKRNYTPSAVTVRVKGKKKKYHTLSIKEKRQLFYGPHKNPSIKIGGLVRLKTQRPGVDKWQIIKKEKYKGIESMDIKSLKTGIVIRRVEPKYVMFMKKPNPSYVPGPKVKYATVKGIKYLILEENKKQAIVKLPGGGLGVIRKIKRPGRKTKSLKKEIKIVRNPGRKVASLKHEIKKARKVYKGWHNNNRVKKENKIVRASININPNMPGVRLTKIGKKKGLVLVHLGTFEALTFDANDGSGFFKGGIRVESKDMFNGAVKLVCNTKGTVLFLMASSKTKKPIAGISKRIKSIEYESDKFDGRKRSYVHDFKYMPRLKYNGPGTVGIISPVRIKLKGLKRGISS